MSVLIAFINIGLLLIMSFLTDGSARYFNVDKKKGQIPVTVTFSAKDLQAAGLAKKFVWNFGDGESITTTNTSITHTYTTAGVYTAKLQYLAKTTDALSKAKDGGSVKIEATAPINILPTASLTCVSNVLNSLECNANGSADTDGTIASYKYEWGDGTDSTSTNANSVMHVYSTSGSKTVKLTVKDNKDGVGLVEKTFNLKENSAPIASFTCQKTGIQKIHCESTSSDADETLSQFNWTLPDGASFTTASFDHTFSRPQDIAIASHNIQLQVTDSLGLTSTISQNVAVDLEVIKESPRGYFKVFEMGTTLELHSFIAKTQFAPKRAFYQIYGASEQELLQTIEIPEFYPNTVVKADIGSFRPGRIFLTIIDWRDQVFKTSIPFSLVEDTTALKPFVEFRAIQSARRTVYLNLNLAFDFDLDFAIKSFNINFGDGQQVELTNDTFLTHTYAAAGTYQVSVTAITNHNTQATLTRSVTVTDNDLPAVNPDATFGYRIFSYAQNVSFYNEKSGTPNGEIISYVWDFGDGSTGTGATQSHFYEPGTYLVSLTVTDTAGLTNTQTQKVTIKADGADLLAGIDCSLQLPYLDYTQKCKVLALDRFNQISRVRVLWGDGTVSVLGTPFDANQGIYFPSKKYTTAGLYSVKVVVNTTRGDVAGFETSLNIVARPPIASIQCYPNNLAVYCDALGSYDPKGSQLSYEFNFGNGHIETNQTGVISYAYPEAGLYDVSVKVTDAQGMSGTSTTKVQAVRPPNQLPVASFNCDSPQPYTMFCWEESIYDPDGTITIKKLSYDDGDYGFLNSNETTRHQFSTSGQHEVTLTVMDNDGGVTTVTKVIEVKKNNPPVANFECNTYGPQRMNCYSTSTDPDNGDWVSTFNWDFGDGVSQSGLAGGFDHTYADSKNYNVKLVVTDQYGATSEMTKNYKLIENQPPVANINCSNTALQTITCNSFSYDPDGNVQNVFWNLDDNSSYTGYSFTHRFASGKDHVVTAKIVDELGSETNFTLNLSVLVNELPKFDIIADNLVGPAPMTVNFEAINVIDNDGTIESFKWIFTEGETSNSQNSSFTFEEAGEYQVKLQVTDNHGGMTEKIINISVKIYSNLVINTDKDEGVANFSVNFDASDSTNPSSDIVKFEWFYKELKIGEGETVRIEFEDVGVHEVELVATTLDGTVTRLAKNINVKRPSIYFDYDQVPGFVGRELAIPIKVYLNSSINRDNISFQLSNEPVGIILDSSESKIMWTPDLSNVGNVEFFLTITDGLLSYTKKIRIEVSKLSLILSKNVSSEGGEVVLRSQNPILNNAILELPSNTKDYELNLYEASVNGEVLLVPEASEKLKNPFNITFQEKTKVMDFDSGAFGENFIDFDTVKKSFEKIYKIVKQHTFCDALLAFTQNIKEKSSNVEFDEIFYKVGSNRVFVQNSLLNTSTAQKFVNLLGGIDSELKDAKIYIGNDEFKPIREVYGKHPRQDQSTIYFNMDTFKGKSEVIHKFAIFHEYYHLLQSRELGCAVKAMPSGLDNLVEGSADVYALNKMNHEQKIEVLKFIYAKFSAKPLKIAEPFKIADEILENGLLHDSTESSNTNFPYETKLLWDFLDFDPMLFFKKFSSNTYLNLFRMDTNKDVLDTLKQVAGADFDKKMVNYVDGISNYSGPKGMLTNYLQYAVFPQELKSPQALQYKEINFDKENVNVISSNEIMITIPVTALGGVSLNFTTMNFFAKLSHWRDSDAPVKIEIISNDKVSLGVRSIIDYGGPYAPSKRIFENTLNSFLGYKGSSSIDVDQEKFIINIANTSIEDFVEENAVKLKITLLVPKFQLDIPGTAVNNAKGTEFRYIGFTNANKNLKISIKDFIRSGIDPVFTFRYRKFCPTCSGDKWTTVTRTGVESVSDFSIPYSMGNDSGSYWLNITATTIYGTYYYEYTVSVPDNKPATISVKTQVCLPNCGEGCDRKSMPYSALLEIRDSDNSPGAFDGFEWVQNVPVNNYGLDAAPKIYTVNNGSSAPTVFPIPACVP